MKTDTVKKAIPFFLTLFIIAGDQFTKAVIVKTIPLYRVGWSCCGGFLRIIHTRNPGIAFSLGAEAGDLLRMVLFILLPLAILGFLTVYYWRSSEFTPLQRWCIAGIIGGGLGNLIDRIFRDTGVVDFIDVKFYGIFGLERWPTFNVADASVVVSGILLLLSFFFQRGVENNE